MTKLPEGQFSFALFSYPYEWPHGNVWCATIRVDDTLGAVPYRHGVPGSNRQTSATLGNVVRGHLFVAGHIAGHIVHMQPVSFAPKVPGSPGAADVPRPANRYIPLNGGTWSGDRGDSAWSSANSLVQAITNNQPVQFRNGYPDFSTWSIFSVPLLPLQHGTQDDGEYDFEMAGRAWARTRPDLNLIDANGNLVSDTAIARAINNLPVPDPNNPGQSLRDPADSTLVVRGYTWHHNQDERTMQLVPSGLNNNIKHQGGAALASLARW